MFKRTVQGVLTVVAFSQYCPAGFSGGTDPEWCTERFGFQRTWDGQNYNIFVRDADTAWVVSDGPRIRYTDLVVKTDEGGSGAQSYEVFVGSSCGRIIHFDSATPGWEEIDSDTNMSLASMSFVHDQFDEIGSKKVFGLAGGPDGGGPVILAYEEAP